MILDPDVDFLSGLIDTIVSLSAIQMRRCFRLILDSPTSQSARSNLVLRYAVLRVGHHLICFDVLKTEHFLLEVPPLSGDLAEPSIRDQSALK